MRLTRNRHLYDLLGMPAIFFFIPSSRLVPSVMTNGYYLGIRIYM